MVVLRFLFRSFTPTFSLYKAVLKTKQNLAVTFHREWKRSRIISRKKMPFFEDRRKLTANAAE